ncbi:hypothetical protein ACFODZ_06770 [Marinicella sediminis]|uniref:DUF2140 family protein n=1 Tax=Marinicella sediminis TaxID=1792834 RepID=A0ABV7J720_9GAMM|nr:hypothetical protein [Marinicella sediminis]
MSVLGFILAYLVVSQVSEFSHDLLNTPSTNSSKPTLTYLNKGQWHTELHLSLQDLVDSDSLQLRQNQVLQARYTGSGLRARNQVAFPGIRQHIFKSIPDLWRVHVPHDWPAGTSPVTVNSLIQPVILRDLQPWVQRSEQLKDGSTIIEGGVRLSIDPALIHTDGISTLQITFDLTNHLESQ